LACTEGRVELVQVDGQAESARVEGQTKSDQDEIELSRSVKIELSLATEVKLSPPKLKLSRFGSS